MAASWGALLTGFCVERVERGLNTRLREPPTGGALKLTCNSNAPSEPCINTYWVHHFGLNSGSRGRAPLNYDTCTRRAVYSFTPKIWKGIEHRPHPANPPARPPKPSNRTPARPCTCPPPHPTCSFQQSICARSPRRRCVGPRLRKDAAALSVRFRAGSELCGRFTNWV